MNDLIEKMKVCLASVFGLYLKTHYFHWNVEGPNFPQYHSFLNDLYEEIYDSIDAIAEEIRTLGAYAPGSFIRYQDLSIVKDETNIPGAMSMISKLQADNIAVIELLKETQKMAEKENAIGLANFLQDRVDRHYKHDWMLKSILKV
jgi:starvation-inducible DNA-binding protein